MLRFNNINVFYGTAQALWNVSFKVDEKEIVALVGANAAGKTTILNTISGLLHPVSGTIEFLGRRINEIQAHLIVEAGISHIPEGRKLFVDMTVQCVKTWRWALILANCGRNGRKQLNRFISFSLYLRRGRDN